MALTQIKGEGLVSTYAIGSEGGAVTTSVQQGVAKAWLNFYATAGTPTSNDSFNVSSLTDDGTGDTDVAFTNSFGNDDYSAVGSVFDSRGLDYGIFGAVAADGSATYTKTTSVYEAYTGYINSTGGGALARDMDDTSLNIHGDLA